MILFNILTQKFTIIIGELKVIRIYKQFIIIKLKFNFENLKFKVYFISTFQFY